MEPIRLRRTAAEGLRLNARAYGFSGQSWTGVPDHARSVAFPARGRQPTAAESAGPAHCPVPLNARRNGRICAQTTRQSMQSAQANARRPARSAGPRHPARSSSSVAMAAQARSHGSGSSQVGAHDPVAGGRDSTAVAVLTIGDGRCLWRASRNASAPTAWRRFLRPPLVPVPPAPASTASPELGMHRAWHPEIHRSSPCHGASQLAVTCNERCNQASLGVHSAIYARRLECAPRHPANWHGRMPPGVRPATIRSG